MQSVQHCLYQSLVLGRFLENGLKLPGGQKRIFRAFGNGIFHVFATFEGRS